MHYHCNDWLTPPASSGPGYQMLWIVGCTGVLYAGTGSEQVILTGLALLLAMALATLVNERRSDKERPSARARGGRGVDRGKKPESTPLSPLIDPDQDPFFNGNGSIIE